MKVYLIDYENVNEQGLKGVDTLENGDMVNIFYSVNIKSMPFERSLELARSKASIDSYLIKKTGKNYLDFQLTTLLGYLICKYEKADFFIISKDTGFDSTVDFWKERNVSISRVASIAGQEKTSGKVKKTESKKPSTKKAIANAKEKQEPVKPEPEKQEQVKQETEKPVGEPENTRPKKEKPAKKSIPRPALPESYRKKVRIALAGEELAPNQYTGIYKAIVESSDKVLLNNALVKQFDNVKGGVIYGKIKNIFKEFHEENK